MNTHDIEPLKYGGDKNDDYVTGWNDCYAAIEADRKRREAPAAEGWPEPLSEFSEGQWWVKELDALKDLPGASNDQKRAVAVVHHLLASVDRKRRGEPVGRFTGKFVMEPDGSKALFVVEAYGAIPGPGAELFSAPQPAEPVKVPSDRDILDVWQEFRDLRPDWICKFARALLARYTTTKKQP